MIPSFRFEENSYNRFFKLEEIFFFLSNPLKELSKNANWMHCSAVLLLIILIDVVIPSSISPLYLGCRTDIIKLCKKGCDRAASLLTGRELQENRSSKVGP